MLSRALSQSEDSVDALQGLSSWRGGREQRACDSTVRSWSACSSASGPSTISAPTSRAWEGELYRFPDMMSRPLTADGRR